MACLNQPQLRCHPLGFFMKPWPTMHYRDQRRTFLAALYGHKRNKPGSLFSFGQINPSANPNRQRRYSGTGLTQVLAPDVVQMVGGRDRDGVEIDVSPAFRYCILPLYPLCGRTHIDMPPLYTRLQSRSNVPASTYARLHKLI